LADGEGQDEEQGTDPAQDRQRVGVNMTDRELSGDDIAAPEGGGEDEDQDGLIEEPCRNTAVLLRSRLGHRYSGKPAQRAVVLC
jgi:hypothetical protein